MTKVLLDARMIDSSGIGTYLQNLIPFLKNHLNLSLLGEREKVEEYIDISNLNFISMKSPIYFPTEQIEFLLKIKDVDIFWSPHFNVPVFPIRAKKRIVTIHDVFHLAFGEFYSPFERTYAKFLINSAVNLSDVIITVSNFSKSEIIKYTGVKEEKIKVIYNGVDRERFRVYEKEELEKIKSEYKLPNRFLLFVGNVKPHKNLRRLLKAFKIIAGDFKDLFLVITGKKEGFLKGDKKIFELINKDTILKERVIFTGHVDKGDLPYLYNLAEIFVFPSLYEGFGLPPLEAMACGCPIVVSHIPPLWEICKDAAYYINPHDEWDIAKGIKEVLENEKLRKELIDKGIERAKEFSWEKSAREHLNLIEKTLFI
ncbi:MAG: glycosyltransferase family 4 protein [Dictyoglomus turgidum]|uniref:glycosyltransferase family 4 protein n=1 Tax=Dictyoglomus turgidum TaxID=513050 RepID=UPI003C796EA5